MEFYYKKEGDSNGSNKTTDFHKEIWEKIIDQFIARTENSMRSWFDQSWSTVAAGHSEIETMVHLWIETLLSACHENNQDLNNVAIPYPATILTTGCNLFTNVIKDQLLRLGKDENNGWTPYN